MRIVAALGGNALLKRGEKLTAENQRRNAKAAAQSLSALIDAGHDITITHGNGPQVGLLALQSYAYKPSEMLPLDVLDAESEGMIGYMIEQEMRNALGGTIRIATLLTQIEVAMDDPAFDRPTKPIGPFFDRREADDLAALHGWSIVEQDGKFRRAVASPRPVRVLGIDIIGMLMDHDVTVICAGGGGIPVVRRSGGGHDGVEAVIDKDHASALLAENLGADMLLLLTDIDGVYANWNEDNAARIERATPDQLRSQGFAEGSMGPKVAASCAFVDKPGRSAAIGSIADAMKIVDGTAGTLIALD